MANFFYTDTNGQKQGPINDQQLKVMAAKGIITPKTQLETDSGHKGVASQIPGLFAATSTSFAQTPPAPTSASFFCTHCGNTVFENAVACMSCGAAPIGHKKFCRQCGVGLNPKQIVCIKCGVGVDRAITLRPSDGKATLAVSAADEKNKITTVLLAFLLGALGIHRFYLGEKKAGILYIPLCFCFGISGFLAIYDAVKFLTMSDEEFAAKFFPETDKLFRW